MLLPANLKTAISAFSKTIFQMFVYKTIFILQNSWKSYWVGFFDRFLKSILQFDHRKTWKHCKSRFFDKINSRNLDISPLWLSKISQPLPIKIFWQDFPSICNKIRLLGSKNSQKAYQLVFFDNFLAKLATSREARLKTHRKLAYNLYIASHIGRCRLGNFSLRE